MKQVPPWGKAPREKGGVHSPTGVEQLRLNVRRGLARFYSGIAQSMWRWDFGPEFDDCRTMSLDRVPERYLLQNGKTVIFRDPLTDQAHILPVMYNGAINIYGMPISWHPMPVGLSPETERFRTLELDRTNSVLLFNDLDGFGDLDYIDAMVSELVDNVLTLNQLQLLAKSPYVFNVREGCELSAKNYLLALCQDKPAVFTYAMGDDIAPVTESTAVTIDPSLFELFDRFECMLLEYLGFPCVPITKRAQQTVSEVQSNDAKLYARRMEKWRMRTGACERAREVLGVTISVHSVIDEDIAQMSQDTEQGTESADEVSE